MVLRARRHLDAAHVLALGVHDGGLLAPRQEIGDRRVARDDDRVPRQVLPPPPDLAEDLVADGLLGLQVPGAVAVEAGLVEQAPEALARALARHLDEAKLRDAVERRLRLVPLEELLERLSDLLA